MTNTIVKVSPGSSLYEALDIMKERSISQLPVMQGRTIVGTINETHVLELLDRYRNLNSLRDEFIKNVMGEILPIVPKTAKLREITPLLRRYGAILVLIQGKLSGILTRADLLDF